MLRCSLACDRWGVITIQIKDSHPRSQWRFRGSDPVAMGIVSFQNNLKMITQRFENPGCSIGHEVAESTDLSGFTPFLAVVLLRYLTHETPALDYISRRVGPQHIL
jgi:hypothetical protein